MASQKKTSSTRQKMINLMYLVFIAMLALNISTDVLNGFDLINDNTQNTIKNTTVRNNQLYAELADSYNKNPQKTEDWFAKAMIVKEHTDSIYNYIQGLKVDIAKQTDGKDADVDNIDKKDNTSASSEIMLSPIDEKGKALKKAIDDYRNDISELITDSNKKTIIQSNLSTEPSARAKRKNQDWLQSSFERMPSIATITYLSEIQSSIKQAEGEALNNLLKNIDFSDIRVNDLNAFVIPESNIVVKGASYKARIALAAVDTTQRPKIVVNGKVLEGDIFQAHTGSSGTFPIEGYIELTGRDGTSLMKKFSRKYTVIEPMATVAPLMMDVVYAGIDNPISISVPGFANNEVRATASGGSLTPKGGEWVAKPVGVGGQFVVTVRVKTESGERVMATKNFRIRALPDPTAFIPYVDTKGSSRIFKTGTLSRNVILNADGIKASIDDGILNIPFNVLGFRTVFFDSMGNVIQEVSNSGQFSSRQLEQIKRLDRGKTFFISSIRAKGPDGIEREISPMEVRVN